MTTRDVIVIGGGLVGCATAHHLAARGISVEVLEAKCLNAGASGANAGSLHFQLERRFLENGDALAEQAARVLGLNLLAIDEWRNLENELQADLHVRMGGGMMVAETPEQLRLLEAKVARETRGGLPSRVIDGWEARQLVPELSSSIVAAGHLACEGHADPKALTPAFAASAARRGVRVTCGARVIEARRTRQGYKLSILSGGKRAERTARKVLIAAGAWSGQIGELFNLHLPLYPVALLMSATERTSGFLDHLIQHVGRRLSMKQTVAGNILIGGGWRSLMARTADGRFDLDRRATMLDMSLTGNLSAAAAVMPRIADLNLIRSWTGVTAVTADQIPLAGEVPQCPGLYVAAGGSAFTLGPVIARLLARIMLDEDEERLNVLSPRRFNHLNSFMGLAHA